MDCATDVINLLLIVIIVFILCTTLFGAVLAGILTYVTSFCTWLYFLKSPNSTYIGNTSSWRKCMAFATSSWYFLSRVWHGYEIIGMENIPTETGVLLIGYHLAFPIDNYYLLAHFYRKNIVGRLVTAGYVFALPGLGAVCSLYRLVRTDEKVIVELLKNGEVVILNPGGVREAQFSDDSYKLVWGKRTGFARMALEAKVPIVPFFTQNGRETFIVSKYGKGLLRSVFEKLRLPVLPIVGGYPVKLRTHFGEPIPYDPNTTVEKLAQQTSDAVKRLIAEKQRLPGSIPRALMDRFRTSATAKNE